MPTRDYVREQKTPFKLLCLFAIIGIVSFFVIQIILPKTTKKSKDIPNDRMINQQQAIQCARSFAAAFLAKDVNLNKHATAMYVPQTNLYGYLCKNKLLQEYCTQWASHHPYEVFKVRLPGSTPQTYVDVDVHTKKTKVIGYRYASKLNNKDQPKNTLSIHKKQELAATLLKQFGYENASLTLTNTVNNNELIYVDRTKKIGDIVLQLKFTFDHNTVRSFEPVFAVPSSYTTIIAKQHEIATRLTYGGHILLTFVLLILAVIYSFLNRRYTSFRRGVLPAMCMFFICLFGYINTVPVMDMQWRDLPMRVVMIGLIWFSVLCLAITAIPTYFCLVAGDGMWRKIGVKLWPNCTEPGYGKHVLHSVLRGYLWACILLGIQSIIFLVLENTLHSWHSIRAEDCPSNMLAPWAFPIAAWVAGISEEAIYRLFGIRMFQKIVRNTFIACLIPSAIWALGHTLYPIYPVITRPIELIILGLLFSYIMLKHGFITAVFTHIIFDSILMGLSLMEGAMYVFWGMLWIVLPLIVGVLIYVRSSDGKRPTMLTPALHCPPEEQQ